MSTAAAPIRRPPAAGRIARMLIANSLGIGIVVLIVVFTIQLPSFATVDTAVDVLRQSAILGLVVAPFALLLISGYVDLSVGSTLALAAVCGALVMASSGSLVLGLLVCVAAGMFVGAINALLVAGFGLSPIIVTLATLTAGRGGAQMIFNEAGQTVGVLPNSVVTFGTSTVLGVPTIALVAIAALLVAALFLGRSVFGRHLYAIGVNERAAFLSGIRVKSVVAVLYVVTGAVTGLAAFVYLARYVNVQPGSLGVGFEIQVLTAVLLGGIAFTGGQGSVGGAVLGVLFLAVLTNGLQQLAVLPATQTVIQGIALGVAAGLQWWSARVRSGRRQP